MLKPARIVAVLLLGVFPGLAFGQTGEGTDPLALCQETGVQSLCKTTCAPACQVSEFLTKHANYCLNNGLIGSTAAPPPDDASCKALFGVNGDTAALPELEVVSGPEVVEVPKDETDCNALESLSAKRQCELEKRAPKCATSVTALIGQSRLLETQIKQELGQYGDLLTVNLEDVNDTASLCAYPRDQLDKFYKDASENPEGMRTLRRQATELNTCQVDWEKFSRDNAGKKSSDVIIDNLTRDAQKQLGPLAEQSTSLGESIAKLEKVAETLIELMDYHIVYCDAAGTPLPPPTGTP